MQNEKKADIKPAHGISKLSIIDDSIKLYKDTAQAQLDYLISFMGEHGKHDTLYRYLIKSGFSENGSTEHMWSQIYEFKNGYFIGTLGNDPVEVKNLQFNDSVKIYQGDVEDWIL